MTSYNRRPKRQRKADKYLASLVYGSSVKRKECCFWCGRQMTKAGEMRSTSLTIDHVMPRALGGGPTVESCRACNEVKGDMHPNDWHKFMRENPEWWKLWRAKAKA